MKITNLRRCFTESWAGTQDSLARAARISPALMSFYMNGRRPLQYHHVLVFARLLGRHPREIVGSTEDM